MRRVRWSLTAARDLDAIFRDSPAGPAVVDRIRTAIDRARAFPRIGRRVDPITSSEVRELVARPFRIAYRVHPHAIEIVCIFDSSRRAPWE